MQRATRLAPSPTGALHLGNARTFLVNWLMARQQGWRIVLRMEDLDGPRIKPHADRQAIEDLRWLGLDWDQGPVYQSPRQEVYREAAGRLLEGGQAYPCVCRRREVEQAASAPHADDGAAVYPGTCRGRFKSIEQAAAVSGRAPAVRFAVPRGEVFFVDAFAGPQRWDAAGRLGDFVIAKAPKDAPKKIGPAAYQLAVVVDDAAMGVTDVVRAEDLLDSTPRQMLLYHAMGLAGRIPRYWHLPLVVGSDGRRLAKRHGDARLAHYREAGVSPQRLLALLGRWCGIEAGERVTLPQLLDRFRIEAMSRSPVVFGDAHDRFLRERD